jgi:peptide deformylase
MPVRPIISDQQDRTLRGKAKRIGRIDGSTRRLVEDMIETMRAAPGVGLAAPQVGVPLRVIVIEYEDQLFAVVNPEIIRSSGEATDEEGCLSAPHWQGPVTRATKLLVKGRDPHGKEVRIKAEGWLARIFQHEVDHLEGILFLDRVHDKAAIHWVEPETREEGAPPSAAGRDRQDSREDRREHRQEAQV